jgi:hypothetical protein
LKSVAAAKMSGFPKTNSTSPLTGPPDAVREGHRLERLYGAADGELALGKMSTEKSRSRRAAEQLQAPGRTLPELAAGLGSGR